MMYFIAGILVGGFLGCFTLAIVIGGTRNDRES